jgi:dienelactone hydrolase
MKALMSVRMLAILAGVATAAPLPASADGVRREMFQASGSPAVVGVISWPAERGTGPLPMVVILPDALGPDWRADAYVAWLGAVGLPVLEVDLQAVAEAAGPGASPPGLAATVAVIIRELSRDPRVIAGRIGVLGFGIGGRAALTAPPAPDGTDRIAARAMLYPGCIGLERDLLRYEIGVSAGSSPVLLMHGDSDAANPPPDCARAAAVLSQWGPVERVEIADTGYAWDRPAFSSEGPTMMPRPDGAGRIRAMPEPRLFEVSAIRVAHWLARALGTEGEAPPVDDRVFGPAARAAEPGARR